jgi:hypothetical protein
MSLRPSWRPRHRAEACCRRRSTRKWSPRTLIFRPGTTDAPARWANVGLMAAEACRLTPTALLYSRRHVGLCAGCLDTASPCVAMLDSSLARGCTQQWGSDSLDRTRARRRAKASTVCLMVAVCDSVSLISSACMAIGGVLGDAQRSCAAPGFVESAEAEELLLQVSRSRLHAKESCDMSSANENYIFLLRVTRESGTKSGIRSRDHASIDASNHARPDSTFSTRLTSVKEW